MTNLGDGAHLDSDQTPKVQTLAVQTEWHTQLKYLKSSKGGAKPSKGRFDIGIATLDRAQASQIPPFAALECGRGKPPETLVKDINASETASNINPSDINKLARDLLFAKMPFGYAIEVYDGRHAGQGEALLKRLYDEVPAELIEKTRLRVAILDCKPSEAPSLKFFPEKWATQVCARFRQVVDSIHFLQCKIHTRPPQILRTGAKSEAPRIGRGKVTRREFENQISCGNVRDHFCKLISIAEEELSNWCGLSYGASNCSINVKVDGIVGRQRILKFSSHGGIVEMGERLSADIFVKAEQQQTITNIDLDRFRTALKQIVTT